MAVCQAPSLLLIHRYREQAPSHCGSGSVSQVRVKVRLREDKEKVGSFRNINLR
jgi:hypothetical protein